MTLVQNIQTTPSTFYTTILSSYKTAAAASGDTVIADLYGAVLVSRPRRADASLAAAISQTPSGETAADTTLTHQCDQRAWKA